jgi:superfamily II DNA or RNA helicase
LKQKTIEVLALILASLNELKQEAASKPKRSNHKHATLIVVPPALVSQWLSEIAKVTGNSLVYEFFDCSTLTFHRKSTKEGPADIVVTTYNALEKSSKKLNSAKILKSCSWGRVVLDEMQEIRSSTTSIATNCEELECERRWMLSGTPLFEGVDDFRGELCFLRLEPFAGNLDDGFFDFAVKNHWQERSRHGLDTLKILSLLMLRRSKSMTIRSSNLPLLGLKPMNIVFEPVPQDRSERALYCFLEFLVHETITHEGKGDETKNKTFLRLLRELCVSPALLNGGLSCSSQLQTLNRLMIDHNRRKYGEGREQQSDDESGGQQTDDNDRQEEYYMSCDEAIRFLSQVQDAARVDAAFETSLNLGGGGGISRRNRATESVEQQCKEAQERAARAAHECEAARSKRAKARWHMALELITTGELSFQNCAAIKPTFLSLWRWRFMVTRIDGTNSRNLPIMLTRGWRPSETFFDTASSKRAKVNWQRALEKVTQGDIYVPSNEGASKSSKSVLTLWKCRFLAKNILSTGGAVVGCCRPAKKVDRLLALKCLFARRPEFAWSYPFSLFLQAIPADVTAKELHKSIIRLLLAKASDPLISQSTERLKVLPVFADPGSVTWRAVIHFAKPIDFEKVYRKSNTADGIGLFCSAQLAWITEEIALAEAKLKEAVAESKVYPCDTSKKNEIAAKKAYKTAELGLRIFSKDKSRAGHVSCTRGFGNLRDVRPKSFAALYESAKLLTEDQTGKLAVNMGIKAHEDKLVQRFGSVMGSSELSQEVQSLSAFDALQALRNGEAEKTKCPICLGPLGCSGGKLKLTRCGHLFCISCLDEFQQTAQGRMLHLPNQGQLTAPCPSCRKPVAFAEVMRVDPERTADQEASEKRRLDAKSLVHEASQMLEKSNGQLDPHLWEALYLAIDFPPGADKTVHGTFTAIPGQFLAHLRHATGMPVYCTPNEGADSFELPSKIRALLSDLPRDERSVVFASSKQTVKHLLMLLEINHIGCRGLFTGQSEAKSESAVQDWKTNDTIRVLVVQAGAAACGLTLTAASKMFILEPFIKHEEEQQAYARLHRYGQEKEVVCKIYYTPVSVESRLLEWRKRATSQAATEERIVYAPLRSETTEDAETAEHNQTRFLLGLRDDREGTEEGLDSDQD